MATPLLLESRGRGIDGFRWCILGGDAPIDCPDILHRIAVTVFFLWLGIRQFRKMERSFADLI